MAFVRQLMTDGDVLPRARAIVMARILCRADIVAHLTQHGRYVRSGQLPTHMQAVYTATERAMRGQSPTESVTRAVRRHGQTGVTREQQVYVWATTVDAYFSAGRLAGLRPSESDLWAYHARSLVFGRTFGVDGSSYGTVERIEQLSARLLGRIIPINVPNGGWGAIEQVVGASWYLKDSSLTAADALSAVEETTPPQLLAALRR